MKPTSLNRGEGHVTLSRASDGARGGPNTGTRCPARERPGLCVHVVVCITFSNGNGKKRAQDESPSATSGPFVVWNLPRKVDMSGALTRI